jgi:DNA anti-recombination protein RmuC
VTVTEARFVDLEARVSNLETWAGPGQANALSEGLRALRKDVTQIKGDIGRIQKTLEQHSLQFHEIGARLDGMDQRFDGMGQRFDRMDQQLDGMDQRFDRMDQRLDGMDQRFDRMGAQLGAILKHLGVPDPGVG